MPGAAPSAESWLLGTQEWLLSLHPTSSPCKHVNWGESLKPLDLNLIYEMGNKTAPTQMGQDQLSQGHTFSLSLALETVRFLK